LISFDCYIENLRKALQNPLPGIDAQFKMAPAGKPDFIIHGIPVKAAVLLLVYPVENKPYIVFMKRPEYDGIHSGQISFPGGKYEKIDNNLSNTAIRETIEELGDKLENVEIIGNLTPLIIPVSKYEVHPFIGIINYQPKWNTDPNEVSYLIEVSVDDLFRPESKKIETWNIQNINRDVPFYKVGNEKIWGATAMILSEFETFFNPYC
jgi:8-oxo-dGTP pyrophosphatase MutT (NUDIX family)